MAWLRTPGGDPPSAYAQLYRNGVIEAVDGSSLAPWGSDNKFIPSQTYEQRLLRHLPQYLQTMREIGCGLPIFIGLSLTNVRGFCMATNSFHRREVINQDTLILPEAEVTDYGADATAILKPLFDIIWNACGHPSSLNFDTAGNWIAR